MIVLGIETTSPRGSVAIVCDGETIVEHVLKHSLKYSRLIIPAIKKILGSTRYSLKDIDRVAVGIGPGSFTGIRVGMAIVKGLIADTSIIPVGVSSLENIAGNCLMYNRITSCIYAQNNEFFIQEFVREDTGTLISQNGCYISTLENHISANGISDIICGPDFDRMSELSHIDTVLKKMYPTAECAAQIVAKKTDGECNNRPFLPLYVRRSVAEIKGPKVFKL